LHLGGVRTALFNYLYARQKKGSFLVRTEDTDQNRFVEGAEQYIFDCLKWCGIQPDESSLQGGPYGPYRQSERKAIYREFAEKLVTQGNAYYAFDTPEELEQMRERLKSSGSESLQYDHRNRLQMNNSLRLTAEETKEVLQSGKPYVIRIKVDPNRILHLEDLIRGDLEFDCSGVDDKVLLKADGMPTYHLAVVVDDYLMKITHAFRGEEWLPSAPVHLLLWEFLFGIDNMPAWAHLPLILKPDGHGKLSKRDGERLGFPVYAMNWLDPNTGISSPGFKELGFLPEAFINFLALLGWNDGTGKEIFTLDELIGAFSIERVHKGGAKFDFEKAKWFNHEWIKKSDSRRLLPSVKEIFASHDIHLKDDSYLLRVIDMIKERCILLHDFIQQGSYFFQSPSAYDEASVIPKWDKQKSGFFESWIEKSNSADVWNSQLLESEFKQAATESGIKLGELQMIFRIMLVGSKMGPAVFEIAGMLGREETLSRVQKAIQTFDQKI
jgi:glutamyl-tRNA synthetase